MRAARPTGRRGVARPRTWPLLLLGACFFLGPSVPVGEAAETPDPQRRGQGFWLALAKDCEVPAGETASGLVGEAVQLLGSPDSVWRDDVGYGVVAACVWKKHALTPVERRRLVETLAANLGRGLGGQEGPGVLLRSFSALDLSILAAVELDDPALDAAGYRALVDAALAYLQGERDLRGLEPGVGWIHATAHTADLLKFLARDRRFTPADQARLLEAAWSKMATAGTPVFTLAEDERLAAAVTSVVRRPDFDADGFAAWLQRCAELEKRVWAKTPPDPQVLDAAQNARNLLRAVYVDLSLPSAAPAAAEPSVAAARERVLATLAAVRRS